MAQLSTTMSHAQRATAFHLNLVSLHSQDVDLTVDLQDEHAFLTSNLFLSPRSAPLPLAFVVFGLGALAAASVISTSAIFLFVTKGACVVRLLYLAFREIQVGELAEEAAQCTCFQIAKGRVRKGSRNISITEGRRRCITQSAVCCVLWLACDASRPAPIVNVDDDGLCSVRYCCSVQGKQ